jgi:hypothetical protein
VRLAKYCVDHAKCQFTPIIGIFEMEVLPSISDIKFQFRRLIRKIFLRIVFKFWRFPRIVVTMMTLVGMLVALWYTVTYLCKVPCRTSVLTGEAWVNELLSGNRRRFRENLRMNPETWHYLQNLLIHRGLGPSRYVSVNEKMAIFLFIVGHAASNRQAQERFQRSGWTITK